MTTVLKVSGMMCQHCEKTVKGALMGISGVQRAAIDLNQKTATVEHSDGVSVQSMKAALEELGYDAETEE